MGRRPATTSNEEVSFDEDFLEKFNALKRFKVKYGHTCVPEHVDADLGRWVQQIIAKEIPLSLKEKEKLKKIDFVFNINYYNMIVAEYDNINPIHIEYLLAGNSYHKWLRKLFELREYTRKHGHSSPSIKEERNLAQWCTYQRRKYKDGVLPDFQLKEFTDLDFFWNPNDDKHTFKDREKFQSQWDKMYGLMLMYKEESGTIVVPQVIEGKYKKLGRWVNTQRTKKANGSLLPERQKKLEDIGFVWNKPDKEFKDRLKLIKEIQKKVGGDLNNARVSRSAPADERRVANYIYRLRKRGTLEDKYKKLLERSIEFDWTPRDVPRGRRKKNFTGFKKKDSGSK